MEERISTEALGENKQLVSEKKKEVQKVEKFLEELLNSRYIENTFSKILSFFFSTGADIKLNCWGKVCFWKLEE